MKRKYFLFFAMLLWHAATNAQQDTTLVYSRPGFEKDPVRSKFKKEILKKDDLWVVALTNKKGVLQESIAFADEQLSIRKGPYQLYKDGILSQKGNYDRGYEVGIWTSYFPDQQVREQFSYSWGKLNGPYKKFWDNGQVKEEANYANGLRSGDRILFYRDGKTALKEFYEADKKITGSYFDTEGKSTSSLMIVQPPKFPGGKEAFYDFLRKEIKYPQSAQKNNIEGTVILTFTVMTDGRIDDVKVVKSPDADLSREAIRVLRYNMYWEPATELGEPVKMKHTIPVKFSLN